MTVTVRRDLSQPTRHIIHVRNHLVSTDMSVAEGGIDAGASPHDLFDASLGACKALTVLWYAQRKAMPVTDIEVLVDHDDSNERKGSYLMHAVLRVHGDLTEAQRQELLTVAQKCPVHKLMTTATVEISTTLEAA